MHLCFSFTILDLQNSMLTLWQADCFNQADCHGQINLVKNKKKNSERSSDERMNMCDM